MANVSHATLTGSQLHEPKGADTAALGTVYVSNGAGSGTWSAVGTSAFTGMVADFAAPIAPAGWLECDGSVVSTTTYSALFGAMSITTSGTRTNGSAVITSLPSTANLKVGYYVFGTGIASGRQIQSIDSGTQITLTGNASTSTTGSFFVSPWLMDTGTITLPNLTANGMFRRSRTSATAPGQYQPPAFGAHTHTVSGTSGINSVDHTHTFSGNTGTQSANHTHNVSPQAIMSGTSGGGGVGGGGSFGLAGAQVTGIESGTHTHAYSGTTSGMSQNHTHTFSATSSSTGDTETRPFSAVFITCVKT